MKRYGLLFILFLHSLFPTTAVWNGSSNNLWLTAANWTPATPPNSSGDIANLNSASAANTNTLSLNNMPITLGQLTLDFGSVGYNISPGGGAGSFIFQPGSGSAILSVTDVNGAGPMVISAPITLMAPLSVNQNSTATLTLSGLISESSQQSLTLAGTGTLVLSNGGNSYSGGTTISGGELSISADNQLGASSGGVTLSGGTLSFSNSMPLSSARNYVLTGNGSINVAGTSTVTLASPGVISGSGTLSTTIAAGQTLTLSGTNTYTGGTTLVSGVLLINNDANLGNASGALTINSGTLKTMSGVTSARAGSFTAAAVIDTNGNTDTFSGSFSGPGTLTVQSTVGGGTLILTGTNHYTGGTTVAANTTLQGTTNGLQGTITLSAASSNLVFNQTFTGTYGGAVSGAGPLTVSGTGVVTFSGSSTGFTGNATIGNGASLFVNGSLQNATLVTVNAGGTLGGTGTVGPTTSSGTLQPGASIGTLTIHGNLILQAGSNVLIETAPLSADLIVVQGMATLTDTLTVDPAAGFYAPTTCYTILTTTTGLAGTFSPVVSTSSNFVPTVTYSGGNVTLCLRALNLFFNFPFSNENTRAVGNNINALSLAGELPSALLTVVDEFAGQSFSSINNALDQMHPAPYSAFTELQEEVDAQLLSLFHRFPTLPCCCFEPNRIWVAPLASSLTLKKHGEEIGAESTTGGLALGYDRNLSDQFVLGVGGVWEKSTLEWHDHRGHGTVNGFYGALYGDYQVGAFYLGASFLGGADLYETSRRMDFFSTHTAAHANYQGIDLGAQLSSAYFFGSPAAHFYPYANFDFLYHHTPRFQEGGAGGLDLTVHARTDMTWRSELGLAFQVQDRNPAETMCIAPTVSIGWVNLCPIQRDGFVSTFVDAPIPFTTHGWDVTWNLLAVDFGLRISYKCFCLSLKYDVEISPDSDTTLFNQYGQARLEWKW